MDRQASLADSGGGPGWWIQAPSPRLALLGPQRELEGVLFPRGRSHGPLILGLERSLLPLPQAIIYEGQDKNPEMCRVLLTHEIMCR